MKKLFTPLLLFLTVLLSGINASAEDELIDLTKDMLHQWDGYGADAKVINPSPSVDFNIGEGYEGGMFFGTSSVAGDIYADLTEYQGIVAEGTPGLALRFLFNRPTQTEGITECTKNIDNDGKLTLLFSEVKDGDSPASFIHLNAVKSWGNGTVKSMKLIPKPDPLALSASWWHQWEGISEGDTPYGANVKIKEGSTTAFEDNLGKKVGEDDMVLGNSTCDGDLYANIDHTKYSGIEGVATPGISIRFFFNRPSLQNGGEDKSVDTDAEGKFYYSFSELGDVPFVHLNFVKILGQWRGGKWPSELPAGQAVVTSMRLVDPLEGAKNELSKQIEAAKVFDEFAKDAKSWDALQIAIKAGESELANPEASQQSLKTATSNITEAIAELKLAEGYEKLTAEMFKEYNTYDKPGEGSATNGAYKLFESANNPYGTGGSDNNRWADLSEYDKLIVTFLGDSKPRLWINRKSYNGQDNGNSPSTCDMLELQVDNGKWSTGNYAKFEQNGDLNIFTVDLSKIKKDYDNVARLHGIKYSGSQEGVITGMYLYTSNDDLELPLENLEKEIAKAEQCDKYLKTEDSWNALQKAIEDGKAMLDKSIPTVDEVEAETEKITEAIANLAYKPGYSELTKEMFKKYTDLNNPGEGETTNCDYNLRKEGSSPYGDCNNVNAFNWADLTQYDKLILRTNSGNPRFCMNRIADSGSMGATFEESKFVDITAGDNKWASERYLTKLEKNDDTEGDVYEVDLSNMVDDYGFARLHAIKFGGYVTGMYLYQDPTPNKEFNLSFEIDDPEHVIIEVSGEEIKDLTAGINEKAVANRAKLSISPAEGFKLTSVTTDVEDDKVALKGGSYSRTIVKPIVFTLVTEEENPFKEEIDALNAIIEKAKLYDGTAKIKEDYEKLQPAIDAALAEIADKNTSREKLIAAGKTITDILDGFAELAPNFSHLTKEMFKKYASVTEPGDGADTNCKYEIFVETKNPYGSDNTDYLKWADLSDYDQLIITTIGDSKPSIMLNRLEANGQLAPTQEESKIIEIYPTGDSNNNWAQYNWATDAYNSTEKYPSDKENVNTYTIDLRKILEDYGFVRLHSIQKQGWGEGYLVTGMYLYKDPNAKVDLTFDIDDPDKVEIKVNDEVITDLKAGENTKSVAFRGTLSIAPKEGFAINSLKADGKDVALTDDGSYTTTILKETTYQIVTADPNAKESIKLNFNVDDASHVVITAGETVIEDFSNDVEVEENTVLTIAAAEGYILKSITANDVEVELTDGKYTTTVTEPVNYTIVTEAEKPADPNALTGAWWHQWEGMDETSGEWGLNTTIKADSDVVFESNLGKELTQGSTIFGPNSCNGDCYADLSEYGGIEGTGTPGITVRLYFNRPNLQDTGLDIKIDIKEDGTYRYDFSELPGNPAYVHLNFVKTALGYQGGKWPEGLEKAVVETMKVFAKPSAAALAKKNLEKEIAKASLYDDYAKTADSFKKLTDAIADGNIALDNDAATADEVNEAITAIQNAITGLKLQEGYSDFTADMFKQYASVENPGEGKALGSEYLKLFVTTDQPLGESTISELNWADLTQYDKFVVTVKEGTPRILMNRLEHGIQEYENGEYSGKFLDMTAGDNHYSTERYLTSVGNAYTVDLAKIVDDFGFARLNALKFTGLVNGLYLYYKDPSVKREYDLTFDIDDASHVVVKVNDETTEVASNGVLKVADRAKLSITPAADYILTSATANDEVVDLINGIVTKTIVKNITYKITTDLADPFALQKEELTEIIENAKLYDETAKTAESFRKLTDAIAKAEAELENEDMNKESLESAGDAIATAIEGLELADNYYQLTPGMYKCHESLENPVETDEDPGCANGLMTANEVTYGNKNNDILKWADLSKYSKLIITTDGKYGPRFFFNRLEANGQQAATMEESKMIDINPNTADAWSSKYLTVDGNKYTIDLRMLVKDNNRLARLHSIQSNTYEKGILVTGMYLYKEPQVDATGVTLDKTEISKLVYGETVRLTATVDPVDATDPIFWISSDDEVASVDEDGNVTVVGVGNATITASCGDFTADCVFECYPQFGDANWDGTIDVADAVDIVNYVIEKKDIPENVEEWTKFYVAGANVNNDEDGNITFADASAAVKLALAQPAASSSQSRVIAASDVESQDALVIGGISTANGRYSIPVTLDNSMEYVALQADIILPEGMNVEVKEGSRVAGSHIMATHKFADNHIRVALYNLGNTAFADNNAPIIEIIADGMIADNEEIVISNIVAADADANSITLTSKAADTNGVEALGFDSNAPVKVYDLNGRYISDKVEGLEQGFYIIRQGNNAKKVRIR